MNSWAPRTAGVIALATGVIGVLFVVTLSVFFVGLFQDIHSLLFIGALNDLLGATGSMLSAVLASVLYPLLGSLRRPSRVGLLAGTWCGALAVTFGSWLIVSGRSGVEQSSYYYFFGNGLIGLWLLVLNRAAEHQALVPRSLSRLGLVASVFMMIGVLGLYGILVGSDGDDFSPLVLGTGISFLGIGLLYPIWCLRLGGWLLSEQDVPKLAAQA
jgi:hypothetical protein